MAWVEDLTICDSRYSLKAIGWLSQGEPFSVGEVPEDFFEKLCQLLVSPWSPPALPVTAGGHHCDLCQFSGGVENIQYKHYQIQSRSSSSLYVPGPKCIYVSPTSVAHYIDAHRYQPPPEYIEAVMQCSTMRSMAYHKAILENGGRRLGKSYE